MSVKSAFGRKGAVVAEAGDYSSSLIANDTTVPGSTLAEAVDNLNAELAALPRLAGDLGGSREEPQVIGLRGRPIANIDPADGDRLFWNASAQQWEPKAGSSMAQAMGVAYEVDFTKLPAQNFAAAGPYTIGGLTWWMKGSPSNQRNAIDPGLGLRLSFLTTSDAGGRPTDSANSTYPQRACFLPFSQLPGFNPLAPTIIRWVSTHATTSPNSGLAPFCGVVSAAASAAALTAAERDTYHLTGAPYGSMSATFGSIDCIRTDNQHSPGNATPPPVINHNGAHEHGLYLNGRVSYEYAAPSPWVGLWTDDPCVMTSFGPWRGPVRANPGFLFIAGGQLSLAPVHIRHLRIEQAGSSISVNSTPQMQPPALQPILYEPVAMYELAGAPDAATLRMDRSGNELHLTTGNGTATADLITGTTAFVPASATRLQRATYTPALQITGALTVTVRMKRNPTGSGSFAVVSGLFNGNNTRNTLFALNVDSVGRLTNIWETTAGNLQSFQSTIAVPAGIWVYVSFRRSATGVQTWGINQTYESSTARVNPIGGSEAILVVGNHDESDDRNFGGALKDLGLWNKELTNEQLEPLFKASMGLLVAA